MLWKIMMTIFVAIVGAGAGAAIPEFFHALYNIGSTEWYTWLWTILLAGLGALPAWYIWKGTKLIPLITNIVVRIMIMITIFLILPFLGGSLGEFLGSTWTHTVQVIDAIAIIGFALIGIWLKS